MKILENVVAFSEYMNFSSLLHRYIAKRCTYLLHGWPIWPEIRLEFYFVFSSENYGKKQQVLWLTHLSALLHCVIVWDLHGHFLNKIYWQKSVNGSAGNPVRCFFFIERLLEQAAVYMTHSLMNPLSLCVEISFIWTFLGKNPMTEVSWWVSKKTS